MIFTVSYSQEKDIWNYLHAGWKNTFRKYGRENLQEKLLEKFPPIFKQDLAAAKTEAEAKQVVEHFLNRKPAEYQHITDLAIKVAQLILDEEKDAITSSLEAAYQESFPFDEITVYLTTFPICPYNYEERWFMAGRNSSVAGFISTAKHELNHFMFYYYYLDELTKRGLNKEKREQLKEALAILTNPEGTDKPAVKELENYIKPLAGKPIREIIEACWQSGLL
ncbi:MAG: hypothetical protein Q8N84_01295 [bacterium]|nr:hypothetical protein [bacterium]